jgi:integrase
MASIIKLQGRKGVTYKVVIRRKGFKTITRNFPTRKAAKDWARDTEGNHDRMTRLGGSGSRQTLSDTIDKYMLQHHGKDKTLPQRLTYWKERLGAWRLSDITRLTITEELDKLKSEPAMQPLRGHEAQPTGRQRSDATVNRFHTALSQVLQFAMDKGLIEVNAARGITKGKESHRFGRALSDEEREALLKASKASEWDRMYLLVTMALSTGARLGELMSLTWAYLDLKNAVAKLSDTKNGSPRHLPLIPSVMEQIKLLPRPIDSTVKLFPIRTDPHESYYHGFRPAWVKVIHDAGITDFRFHDLRPQCRVLPDREGRPTGDCRRDPGP